METVLESRAASNRDEALRRLRAAEDKLRSFHATALHVYGSAARDELHAASDVDLFIDFDVRGPFSFVELIRLEQTLADIVGRSVDLTTRDGLHPALRPAIERSSIQVF